MSSWRDNVEDEEDDQLVDDFGFGGKDAVIFVIDAASPKMHQPPMSPTPVDKTSEDSLFVLSLKCVHATLRQKVLASPNDFVGVLLFGTDKKVDVAAFDNLSAILPLDNPSAKGILSIERYANDLSTLEKIVGPLDGDRSSKVSIDEALWHCQSMFGEVDKVKLGMKKIMFFTCNDNPYCDDEKAKRRAVIRAGDCHNAGIDFEVIPLAYGEDEFDWTKFYGDMMPKEDEEGNAILLDKTGPAAMQKLDDLRKVVRKKVHKKRSVGKCNLDLGNGVQLAVSTYNLVQRASKQPRSWLTKDTNEEVRTLRQLIDPKTGAPLLPSEVDRFMEYGGMRIKFTADEIKAIQKSLLGGSFGLKLLFFRPVSHILFGDFVKSAKFIYPDESSIKGSRNLFAALHERCWEREVMAICSYKPRAVSSPTFVSLVAQKEEKDSTGAQKTPPGFLVNTLPFSDDLRQVPDPALINKSTEEQKEVVKEIMDKMYMSNFTPEAFENPALQDHYRLLEQVALHATDAEDEDENQKMIDLTMPNEKRLKKKMGDLGRRFMEVTQPSQALINEFGGKATAKRPAGGGAASGAAKKIKVEDGGNEFPSNMDEIIRDGKVSKLTVKQLTAYLSSKGRNVGKEKKQALVDMVMSL